MAVCSEDSSGHAWEPILIFRAFAALFVGATVLLCLAAFGLSNRSLSCDESFLWQLAQSRSTDELCDHLEGRFGPPLYYVALRFWVLAVGDHVVGLRSMSVLSYGASLFVIYLLARDVSRMERSKLTVVPETVGFFAVILAATAGSLLRWASDANIFSFVCFLGIFSSWILVRAIHHRSIGFLRSVLIWSTYYSAVVVMLYSQYTLLWTIVAHACWIGSTALWPDESMPVGNTASPKIPRSQIQHRSLVGLGVLGCALLTFAPWVPSLVAHERSLISDHWPLRTTAWDIAATWSSLLMPNSDRQPDKSWILSIVPALSTIAVVCLFYSSRRCEPFLALLIAVPVLVPSLLTLQGLPCVDELSSGQWLGALGFLAIGLAALVCRLSSDVSRFSVLAILISFNSYYAMDYVNNLRLELKLGVEGAVNHIRQRRNSTEPIIVRDPAHICGVLYYLRHDESTLARVYLLPRYPLDESRRTALAANLCTVADLDKWTAQTVWVVDGAPIGELLAQAKLPEPWRSKEITETFMEPISSDGKVVVTPNWMVGQDRFSQTSAED